MSGDDVLPLRADTEGLVEVYRVHRRLLVHPRHRDRTNNTEIEIEHENEYEYVSDPGERPPNQLIPTPNQANRSFLHHRHRFFLPARTLLPPMAVGDDGRDTFIPDPPDGPASQRVMVDRIPERFPMRLPTDTGRFTGEGGMVDLEADGHMDIERTPLRTSRIFFSRLPITTPSSHSPSASHDMGSGNIHASALGLRIHFCDGMGSPSIVLE